MGRRHDAEDQLRHILKQAYRARDTDPVPDVDARVLMGRLHRLAASRAETLPGAALDRFFWRLVPVAGALIAILVVLAGHLYFIPDVEVWSMLHYENEAAATMQTLLL